MTSPSGSSNPAPPGADPAAPASRTSLLTPFESPIFRAVWIASLVSNFGGMIQSVGASWMMTSIGSTGMVALVQASITLPIMLLSLPAGALADTFDRRKMLLAAQGFMLAMSVCLAVSAWMGWITPWTLLLFTFLIGCGGALNGPAWQASVGDMVPRRDLAGAVALNSMGFNLARSLGPAIGGAIVAVAGAAAAITVNTFSYLGLLLVLSRWRPLREAPLLPRESLWVAMGAGVRYGAMSGRIGAMLVRALVFGIAGSAVQALMPIVARDTLGGGPQVFGLLLGAFGVGAVGGALTTTRLRTRLSNELMVRWSCVIFGLATVGLAFSTWLPAAMLALTLAGAAWVLALSTFNVTVQMSAPRWVVGRALALYQMAAFGGMAFGSWIWGFTAEKESLLLALCGAGVVQLVCAAIGLRYPLTSTLGLNLDLAGSWTEPDLAMPIEPRSGPVAVTIEYVIAEADVNGFLLAMAERRRVRRRDGSRNWTLMRDLADPSLWIERYQSPTWLDYVRQNQRITEADREVNQRVLALHSGPDGPKVRRMIERPTRLSTGPALEVKEMPEPMTDPNQAT